MEYDDPLTDGEIREAELDGALAALLRSDMPPGPSAWFVSRTMSAVKRAPLAAGRRPLRSPVATRAGWGALIAGVAVSAWAMTASQPLLASVFASLVTGGVGAGVRLTQVAGAGLSLLELFTSVGLAVSRAVVTREGSAGLALIAMVGVLSLTALHRLLWSSGPERGVSSC